MSCLVNNAHFEYEIIFEGNVCNNIEADMNITAKR